jgi:hypothetical protein
MTADSRNHRLLGLGINSERELRINVATTTAGAMRELVSATLRALHEVDG